MKLTTEQNNRVKDAIRDCEKFIAKESKYLDHLQNKSLLEWHKNHIEKLKNMLAA